MRLKMRDTRGEKRIHSVRAVSGSISSLLFRTAVSCHEKCGRARGHQPSGALTAVSPQQAVVPVARRAQNVL
jgi:hypothetical protein